MAKRPSKAQTPEVIDVDVVPESPELALARTDGGALASFIAGIALFFTRAKTLETRAKQRLLEAKQLTQPATVEEDETIKSFVRQANLEKKQVEEHWEVTTLVSRFHKRLTGARALATNPLEEAARIATNLHTRYADAERARVAAEQERLRLEAEAKERARIAADAAVLEANALALEDASNTLSTREQVFVDEVFRTQNGPNAARVAGYKDPTAQSIRLLASEKVQRALEGKREGQVLRQQAAAAQAAPVHVTVEEVRPNLAAGKDRETWSAEVLDERALVDAVLSGKFGIPTDVLTVNTVRLNAYAKDLQQVINRWPGVRAKRTTGIR